MAVWGYGKYIKVQDEEPRRRCPGCAWVLLDDELGIGGANGIYSGSDTLTQLNTVATIPSGGTLAFAGDFAGNLLLLDGDSGKVTIDGLLDPSGVQFTQQASNPGDPNTIWIDNVLGHAFRGDFDLENALQPTSVFYGNALIAGGVICEDTGLDCVAWASEYIIDGVRYTDLVTANITLSPPDLTNSRIDVFVVDNTGTISVIEGIPSATPLKPDIDEETQVELGFAIVNIAGDVENLTEILVFDENIGAPNEWTVSVAPTGGNPADGTQFYNGASSYSIPQTVSTDILRFTTATPVTTDNNNSLVFSFRTALAWANNDRLRVRLINTTTGINSSYVVIRPTNDQNFGLDMTSAGVWQVASIPIFRFNNVDTEYDGIQFKFDNATAGTDVWIDYVRIQGGVYDPTPGVGNGIYSGSGNVPDETVATLSGDMTFSSAGGEVAFNTTFGTTDRTNLFFSSDIPLSSITPPYSLIYNGRQTGSGSEIIALGTTSQLSPNIITQLAMQSNDSTGLVDLVLQSESGFAGAGTIRTLVQSKTSGTNTSPAVTQLVAFSDGSVDSNTVLEIDSQVITGNGDATLDVHATTPGTGTSTLELLAKNTSTGSSVTILGADDNGTRGGITVQSTGVTVGDYLNLGVNDYTIPLTRGTNGQVLQTDGSGNVTWQTISGADGNGIYDGSGSLSSPTTVTGGGNSFVMEGNGTSGIRLGTIATGALTVSEFTNSARLTSGTNAILDTNNGNAVNMAINGAGTAQIYVGTGGDSVNTTITQTQLRQFVEVTSAKVVDIIANSSGNYTGDMSGYIDLVAGTGSLGALSAGDIRLNGSGSLILENTAGNSMTVQTGGGINITASGADMILQAVGQDIDVDSATFTLDTTGVVDIDAGTVAQFTATTAVQIGDSSVPTTTVASAGALNVNTASGNLLLQSGLGNVNINAPVGQIQIGTGATNYNIPNTRGTANQILKTDGSGNVTWQNDDAGSATALSTGTVTDTTYGITSDGATDDVIIAQAVASTSSGVMSGTDKAKLDGIEASADVTDQTNVNSALGSVDSPALNVSAGAGDAGKLIKLDAGGHVDASMINDADINLDNITEGVTNLFFTSADNTKLDGIEALADVTDEANVVSALDGATLTAVTVAGTDKVLVQDADDADNLKTVTAQSIADLATNKIPVFKSYSFRSQSGSSGERFLAGFYEYSTTDANLTQASTTVVLGSANHPYGARPFAVAGGAGTTDGSDLVLTISGTSITDAGVRTAGDSEVLIADCTTQALNQYTEPTKKWIGQVTYTLSSTGGTAFSFDFNYGFTKYEDFGNRDFTITDFEVIGYANVADSGIEFELLHHKTTGWTYASTGFVAGSSAILSMNTDYSTEQNTSADTHFAYKRSSVGQFVDGNGSEGVIVRITTGTNNSVSYLDAHIGVELA